MTQNQDNSHPVVDWDDMTEEDKKLAMQLLSELNELFDRYTERDEGCDDSILDD
jgi:hypothetical protein